MWFGYHTVSINYCFVYINAILLVHSLACDQLLIHYYSLYSYASSSEICYELAENIIFVVAEA